MSFVSSHVWHMRCGSRVAEKSISDKVSVRKLYAFSLVSCVCGESRLPSENIYFSQGFSDEIVCVFFFVLSCSAYVMRVAGRGDNLFLTRFL